MGSTKITGPNTSDMVSTGTNDFGQRGLNVIAIDSFDHPHLQCHEGKLYTLSHFEASISDDASLDLVLNIGSNIASHTAVTVSIGGDGEFHIYEEPSFTDGTAVTIYNNNRESSNTTSCSSVHTPSVSEAGTAIFSSFITGGTGNNFSVGGGAGGLARGGVEWILRAGYSYLFRLTNRSGQAQAASISVTFYEATSHA